MRRWLVLLSTLCALPSVAGVMVPADLGVGPAGYWFFGPLTQNRGAVPHFALAFDLAAVIDRDWLDQNQAVIPAKYKSASDSISELRIGASIFIPSTLYISPPIDALGSVGLFGVTWTPLGLTLVNTGKNSLREGSNKSRGHLTIDAGLLLTYLFVFNTAGYDVPTTHFLRPGLQLRTSLVIHATEKFLISFGGGAQIYLPQRMGSFFELGPLSEAMWLSVFAFLQFHFRFPYEVTL